MNKSLTTNLVTVLIIIAGYFTPVYREQILSIGFFALSGAITNWLAIYMLFEKIPFLYGSGVIPNNFEEFKRGIKELIMQEFFTDESIDRFFRGEKNSVVANIDFDKILSVISYDKIFNDFLNVIQESPLGGMLSMVGGMKALEPLRQPFTERMRVAIHEVTQSEDFLAALEDAVLPSHMGGEMVKKIENIVDQRLEELTPTMVKEIIQRMIQKHLGWLVVWGGVFGGLIGLVMSFVK